jgi:hypothetical protein
VSPRPHRTRDHRRRGDMIAVFIAFVFTGQIRSL